jgi:hypothetical protein
MCYEENIAVLLTADADGYASGCLGLLGPPQNKPTGYFFAATRDDGAF